MNPLVKFFHELFNPHCEHCAKERLTLLEQEEINREIEQANKICQSCENLKMQLAVMNQLVDKLTTVKEENKIVETPVPHKVILPNNMSWRVRQQTLEQNSRIRAAEIRAEQSVKVPIPDIDKLETELGIKTGTDNGTEAVSN